LLRFPQPFGDVGSDRSGTSAHLAGDAVQFMFREVARQLVALEREGM